VTIIFVILLDIKQMNTTNKIQAPLTFMAALFTIPRDDVRISWKGGRSIGYMGKQSADSLTRSFF
jgi:hypothetical protein